MRNPVLYVVKVIWYGAGNGGQGSLHPVLVWASAPLSVIEALERAPS